MPATPAMPSDSTSDRPTGEPDATRRDPAAPSPASPSSGPEPGSRGAESAVRGPAPGAVAGGRGPTRWPYAALAYLFVGLALVGVVVPGLPTFPFLLLAAWAAARGSKRLHDWLYDHPKFGAALIEWERERAVSRRSKLAAVALMALSWIILVWRTDGVFMPVLVGAVLLVVGGWLVRRPVPGGKPADRAVSTGVDPADAP